MTISTAPPPPADVAILTVIPPELDAARAALGLDPDKGRRKDKFSGTVFLEGSVFSHRSKRDVRVVLSCVGGAGNPAASAAASEIVLRYRPKVVLLMGIAAGMRGKTKIGDVILSERVVAYEPAALVQNKDGSHVVQPRPEIDRTPHTIQQDVMHYEANVERIAKKFRGIGGIFPEAPDGLANDWKEHVAVAIRIQKGVTLAAGEKLLRDPAKLIELRRDVHGKIEVGEMEAAGLVEACRRHGIPWLVIRGISDFGDEFKHDEFHALASKAAAAVLVDFIEQGLELGNAHEGNAMIQEESSTHSQRVVLTPQRADTPQNADQLQRDWLSFLAERYSTVGAIRTLWIDAGGRASEMELADSIGELWSRMWRRSKQGAYATPLRLLECVGAEHPNEPLIALMRDYLTTEKR